MPIVPNKLLDLVFRTEAAKVIGVDPRTLSRKHLIYPPIGVIEVNRRKFPVYSRESLEETKEFYDKNGGI
jgi:hypothetical protein